MWHDKQGSPASSTSTVDQQEIILEELQHQQQQQLQQLQSTSSIRSSNVTNKHQPHQQQSITQAPGIPTPTTTTGRRQTNTVRATKRPRNSFGTGSAGNSRCSPPKRPKLFNLAQQQLAPWKSLQHHFLRHTDVKYRPEKRMTMAELGNEVLQRRNGWKVHHLVGQLTDLIQNELQNRQKISTLLQIFIERGFQRIHDLANNCHKLPEQYAALLKSQRSYGTNEFKPELIVTKLDDLLRGDLQRSNMFDGQLRDCRDLVVQITNEHRDRVARLTTKFNKRIQL